MKIVYNKNLKRWVGFIKINNLKINKIGTILPIVNSKKKDKNKKFYKSEEVKILKL